MFPKRSCISQLQIIPILLYNLLFFLNFTYQAHISPVQITTTVSGSSQSFPFSQDYGNYFIIDNSGSASTVEISVNLSTSPSSSAFLESCYLLIICGKIIPDSEFVFDVADMTYSFASNFQTYDIYDMDLDGFSTKSKKLSALADMTSSTPKNILYAYLLGPYKFGGSSP